MESQSMSTNPKVSSQPIEHASEESMVFANLKIAKLTENELIFEEITVSAGPKAVAALQQRKVAMYLFVVDYSMTMQPHLSFVEEAIIQGTKAILKRDADRFQKSYIQVIYSSDLVEARVISLDYSKHLCMFTNQISKAFK